MALQRLKATALGNAPDSSESIIATGYDNVSLDLETTNTGLMANKNVFAKTGSDIPDS
jgi:hypothetical protein